MTVDDMIDTAACEVAERAQRAFTMILVAAEEEGVEFTGRQAALVASALIEQFHDLKHSLRDLARGSDLIARLAPYDMTTIGDDVEAWLAEHGPEAA